MNSTNALKLVHQFRKSFGLKIPRKHGVVNHGQSICAEFKILPNLSSTVLESYNLSGPVRGRPEAGVVFLRKSKKNLGSRINTLIFGSSIQEGTYPYQEL
jgi:hypothetical protein